MNERHRYIETLLFGRPDRIPFAPGEPRESTLAAWRRQGLAAGADWRVVLAETLGIDPAVIRPPIRLAVDFRLIPQFEEKVLDHRDGHYIVQDWKGNVCEISDAYDVTYLRLPRDFVTRRWIRCPVESRADFEQLRERYDPDALERFGQEFRRQCETLRERDRVLAVEVSGPFWVMREWCGFEGLCTLMVEQPDFVADMAAFWTRFVSEVFARLLRHIVPDTVVISEDMAYKGKAMISPEMTRRYCAPAWTEWTRQLRAAGCPVVDIDSDGYVGGLIPLWIESDVHVCNPMEVAALNDIVAFRREFGREMAYRGGVDKRAMARGVPAIRSELERIEPVVRDGGFIPGCDHGVPADVSWPDFVEYSRLLAQMTGWR